MSQSTITITIGGTPTVVYGPSLTSDTLNVIPHSIEWDLDDAARAEFSEDRSGPVPSYTIGQAVAWDVPLDDGSGGVAKFRGEIVDVSIQETDAGYAIGYLASGLKYVCDKIPVTNTASAEPGVILFNLPQDDPDYVAVLAGQTVGQIIAYTLDLHAAALNTAGVGTGAAGSAYLAADLAALAIVPPEPVLIRGPLLAAIDSLLDNWSPIYSACVQYQATSSTWVVRVLNSTTFADRTLTLGTDPVLPPSIRRDGAHAASRVAVRGLGDIQAAVLRQSDGTFLPNFPDYLTGAANPTGNSTVNSNAKSHWNLYAFTQPQGAVDRGTIGSVGTSSVTITSSNPAQAVAANYWNGISANIWLQNSAATDMTFSEQRRVTTNTAETAGASFTVSWDASLPVSSSGFTNYYLVGLPPTGLNETYRRYGVPPQLAGRLVKRSPYPLPFAQASLVVQTNYPMAIVYDANGTGYPATFQVDVKNSQIVFDVPIVQYFNSTTTLQAGGSGVTDATEIVCLVMFSKGALEAHYPADGTGGVPTYGGTSFTADGLQRTWTIDVGDAWAYRGDSANMLAFAQMMWQSVCDTVVTGEVTYHGKLAWAIAGLGNRLSIANATGLPVTGWETLKAPVRSVTLEFCGPDDPDAWRTHLKLNNRRRPKTGEAYYVHPRHPFPGPGQQAGSPMMDIGLAAAGASGALPVALLAGAGAGDVQTPFGSVNASQAAQQQLDAAAEAGPEPGPEGAGGGAGGDPRAGLPDDPMAEAGAAGRSILGAARPRPRAKPRRTMAQMIAGQHRNVAGKGFRMAHRGTMKPAPRLTTDQWDFAKLKASPPEPAPAPAGPAVTIPALKVPEVRAAAPEGPNPAPTDLDDFEPPGGADAQ